MNEKFTALIEYRLEQAAESIESAQTLFEKALFRSSINRSYYAMFYAALALLVIVKKKSSKHSGVTSLFDKEYIQTGIFDKQYSKWLHDAFNLRQLADYREMYIVSKKYANTVLENSKKFLKEVKRYLDAKLRH
ncbi:MAG: HEPN domain-containing protein [Candidatus Hatepunaea meridiana]|nr:HEPN domain-containing protein [Candidatus Hatepunaea meridiana]